MNNTSLVVTNMPTNVMAMTNLVYMNPIDADRLPRRGPVADVLICVDRYLFTVQSDPSVEVGKIALNAIQRRASQLSSVKPDAIDLSSAVFRTTISRRIKHCLVKVGYMLRRNDGALDCHRFLQSFRRSFVGQFFVEGQVVAMAFEGRPYCAVFSEIVASESLPHEDSVPFAALEPQWEIVLQATEASEITIVDHPIACVDE